MFDLMFFTSKALKYLGYDATPSKIRDVRKRVGIDQSGSVTYGGKSFHIFFNFDFQMRFSQPMIYAVVQAHQKEILLRSKGSIRIVEQ